MSISAALNAAQSGLTAASRAAQTVSSNVANALTPGYGVREVSVSSADLGGVSVDAVTRRSDIALVTERRAADASLAGASTLLSGLESVRDAVGTADAEGSVGARLGDLEARLLEAASRPDSAQRLSAAVGAAGAFVDTLNAAGRTIQEARLTADRGIDAAVGQLNEGLGRIAELNDRIVRLTATGNDANALIDQRHRLVDEISDIVPLKQIERENGRVALITGTGRLLLDGDPVPVTFSGTNGMSAGAALGAPLSGLAVGDRAVDMTNPRSQMAGGRLEALFALRDTVLLAAQARLDTLAFEVGTRFQDAGLGDAAGLFTEAGAPLGATSAPGLAQRLSLSAAVDPGKGGAAWRLRDGLGAGAPGLSGDGTRLSALAETLGRPATPAGTALGTGALSLVALGDALVGAETAAAYGVETDLSRARGRSEALTEAELATGVNTDAEMQKLMQIEQSYAANARVIQVAGSLIDRILEI